MNAINERQKKLFYLLKQDGFDKVILGEPMSIYYLTGISIVPYERFYGLVIDLVNESMEMIIPSVSKGCMENVVPEVTYYDEDGPSSVIKNAIAGCKKVGTEKKYFSMHIGEIMKQTGLEIFDVETYLSKLRMYKDAEEIAHLQRAADISDSAIEYVSTRIKPGMTETELKMMLLNYMSSYPDYCMDGFIILVLAAGNSANPHGVSGDYVFKDGDIVLMDFGAYCNGYWSDITRCLFLGHVGNAELAKIYHVVHQANLAALSKVKPGVSAKEIDEAARTVIEEAGYGDLFLHRTGHGLGLSVHEEPYITSANDMILEEGMVFTIEPGIYIAGIGGVRIEDDVLVTKDGYRTFTNWSKKLEDNIVKCDA